MRLFPFLYIENFLLYFIGFYGFFQYITRTNELKKTQNVLTKKKTGFIIVSTNPNRGAVKG